MTEKSEFREMRSFDLAIRRAYFKAKIRRNYAKNVVINRSENACDRAVTIRLSSDTIRIAIRINRYDTYHDISVLL